MNKIIVVFAYFFLGCASLSFADQTDQVITLKDGSQINGQVTSITDGVYTVKTPIIGDVHVAVNDVASISNAGTATANTALPAVGVLPSNVGATTGQVPTNPSVPITDQQVSTQQQQIMANPQAMSDLQQLTQDPAIMQALSDPALVQAVTSHDYQAIQNNPKMQELMNNPKMQALMQKIAAQEQQQNTASQ